MPGEIYTEQPPATTPLASVRGWGEKNIMIGLDLDTTGKRLIDEIIQLAAYAPEPEKNTSNEFSQYIIPYMNLNQAAKMRHQVRVITMGFYRVLKNMHTHKVVKTKTEYVAINEFMEWLEERKRQKPDSNGIVLIYHDARHFVPCMLLSALKRYNMIKRFSATVVGFANSYSLALNDCGKSTNYLSLRQLAKMMLNLSDDEEQKLFEGSACVRAKLSYDIFAHIMTKTLVKDTVATDEEASGDKAKEDKENGGDTGSEMNGDDLKNNKKYSDGTVKILSVEEALDTLTEQQEVISRQKSLRPLFVNYFRSKLYHRSRAVHFRRTLAEHGYDMDKLQLIWEEKKMEGFAEAIEKLDDLGDKKTELVKLLDSHFDPEKSPIKPAPSSGGNSRRSYRTKSFRSNASSEEVPH